MEGDCVYELLPDRVPLLPASDPPGSRTSCSQGGPAKDRVGVSPVAQTAKNLPAVQEIQVQSLGWEDSLEKGRTTHSSSLAWRIPWTEEPVRLQSMGLQRVRHDLVTNATTIYSGQTVGFAGFIGRRVIGGKQNSFGIKNYSCMKVYVVMSSRLNSCWQTGDHLLSFITWPLTPPYEERLDSAPDESVVTAAIAVGPWMLSAYSFNHSFIQQMFIERIP